MVEQKTKNSVSKTLRDGRSINFHVVADPVAGRLYLWLEPGMDPDDIMPLYRITAQGVDPIQSWQGFQDGDEVANYAGEKFASMGAIESLDDGVYVIEASVFTGLSTIRMPPVEIELQSVAEEASRTEEREDFNVAFIALFQKFFDRAVSDVDAREYCAAFDTSQADFLADAIVDLGAPEDYLDDDETLDLGGYFDFIEYVSALMHYCGDGGLNALAQHPDSPTNRHYIAYVKKNVGDEKLLSSILEKYPFCSRS